MSEQTVYLNGVYLPLQDAKISVLDRGFLFGDGVYEVIPVYNGHIFRIQAHLQRLDRSLKSIRLQNPHSTAEWLAIFEPFLETSKDQYFYLQITRGVAPKRDHAFPESVTPTVFVMCSDIKPFEGKQAGIKALTLDDTRWEMCHIKAITLLANILLRQEALDQGSAEALLVNKQGIVTEGAASNVFAVIDGVLVTPLNDGSILPGITRDVILELARRNGIACREQVITLQTLKTASEIWVTSSTREIIPVISLDGEPVADAKPGPIFKEMDALLQKEKKLS
ncbi:MAG: D-amino acid aminotransferase [Methylococcaceae bacterium]|nr:D-amino acid aminotransferase [Methylococcaceae bacterium]